jgi:hypothetical protein
MWAYAVEGFILIPKQFLSQLIYPPTLKKYFSLFPNNPFSHLQTSPFPNSFLKHLFIILAKTCWKDWYPISEQKVKNVWSYPRIKWSAISEIWGFQKSEFFLWMGRDSESRNKKRFRICFLGKKIIILSGDKNPLNNFIQFNDLDNIQYFSNLRDSLIV